MMRRSKYGNKKAPCRQGHVHDSIKEAGRCNELHLLQKAGAIDRLHTQVRIPIVINGKKVCDYVADFTYFEGGIYRVEDTKGHRTDIYILKKKLVEAMYPEIKIRET